MPEHKTLGSEGSLSLDDRGSAASKNATSRSMEVHDAPQHMAVGGGVGVDVNSLHRMESGRLHWDTSGATFDTIRYM
jgi:hypothetical protein